MEAPQIQTSAKGRIVLSEYPFDVIVKCNKFYYDVVDVLAEKGLGKSSEVEDFKKELEGFISKGNDM